MNDNNSIIKKFFYIFSAACIFILLQYILMCFYFSFTTHFFNIILMACNAELIMKYWEELSHIIENKIMKILILCGTIAAVGFILLTCGYFPVSTTFKEVPL